MEVEGAAARQLVEAQLAMLNRVEKDPVRQYTNFCSTFVPGLPHNTSSQDASKSRVLKKIVPG